MSPHGSQKEEEIVDPILVKTLTVNSSHATLPRGTYRNVRFWNVKPIVNAPYYWSILHQAFVRRRRIKRITNHDKYVKKHHLTWPIHPTGVFGSNVHGHQQQLGAVVVIESSDHRVLMVRNGKKWGLPKGARNFVEYQAVLNSLPAEGNGLVVNSLILQTPETPEENIIREVLEETGIVLDQALLQPVMLDRNKQHKHAYARFVYKLPHPASHVFHEACLKAAYKAGLMDHENDEMRWIPVYDVIEMVRSTQSDHWRGSLNAISLAFLKDMYVSSHRHYRNYQQRFHQRRQNRFLNHHQQHKRKARIFRGMSS